jgi:hypothetical protein
LAAVMTSPSKGFPADDVRPQQRRPAAQRRSPCSSSARSPKPFPRCSVSMNAIAFSRQNSSKDMIKMTGKQPNNMALTPHEKRRLGIEQHTVRLERRVSGAPINPAPRRRAYRRRSVATRSTRTVADRQRAKLQIIPSRDAPPQCATDRIVRGPVASGV